MPKSGFSERVPKPLQAKLFELNGEIAQKNVWTRSFRWGKEQLAIVRQAAENMGVPYQTFIKMCVYQRALDVLKDVQAAKVKDRDAA